jgi:hypothetical protein
MVSYSARGMNYLAVIRCDVSQCLLVLYYSQEARKASQGRQFGCEMYTVSNSPLYALLNEKSGSFYNM